MQDTIDRKPYPEIFLKAANMIAANNETYCCFAISKAVRKYNFQWAIPEKKFFERFFEPTGRAGRTAYWYDDVTLKVSERREARVMALLLCYHMLTDEETKPKLKPRGKTNNNKRNTSRRRAR